MLTIPILTIKNANTVVLRDEKAIQMLSPIYKNELQRDLNSNAIFNDNEFKIKYKCEVETKKAPDIFGLSSHDLLTVFSIIKFGYELRTSESSPILPYRPVDGSVNPFIGLKPVKYTMEGNQINCAEKVNRICYRPIFTMRLVYLRCKSQSGVDTWQLELEEV
jgi:hypothetical protein